MIYALSAMTTAAESTAAPGTEIDARAHRCRWLHTGSDAFAAMIDCVDSARSSVRLEQYILMPSVAANALREALVRAVSRGLAVKILIDSFGSAQLPESWTHPLIEAGADLRRFNPRPFLTRTFRDHRKLLVCDQRRALFGGFNIAEEYDGDGIHRGWRDLGLLVEGPLAESLAASFDATFDLAPFHAEDIARYGHYLCGQTVPLDRFSVIASGPLCPRSMLRRTLQSDLRAARSVDIIAAYFAPSRQIRRLLRRVVRREGRVRLILPAKTDVAIARLASQRLYPSLLRRGVEIYEYQPQILHAKAIAIDDIVYLGSANLDIRSLRVNLEFMVRLPSPMLAAQLRDRFEEDLRRCERIPRDWGKGRPLWQRILQYAAYLLLVRIDPYVARQRLRSLRS
jgi:cardiolipin synthase A/B